MERGGEDVETASLAESEEDEVLSVEDVAKESPLLTTVDEAEEQSLGGAAAARGPSSADYEAFMRGLGLDGGGLGGASSSPLPAAAETPSAGGPVAAAAAPAPRESRGARAAAPEQQRRPRQEAQREGEGWHRFMVLNPSGVMLRAKPSLASDVVGRLHAGWSVRAEPRSNGWLWVPAGEANLPSGDSHELPCGAWALMDSSQVGLRHDLFQWEGVHATAVFSEAVEIAWPLPPRYEPGWGVLAVEWASAESWREAGEAPADPLMKDRRRDIVPDDCRSITVGGLPPGCPVKLRVFTAVRAQGQEAGQALRPLRSRWVDTATLVADAAELDREELDPTQRASSWRKPAPGLMVQEVSLLDRLPLHLPPADDDALDCAGRRLLRCRACAKCAQWVFDGRAPLRRRCRRCGCTAGEHQVAAVARPTADAAATDAAGSAAAPAPAREAKKARRPQALSLEMAVALQEEMMAAFKDDAFQCKLKEAHFAGRDRAALEELCLEVQAPILASYGFQASQEGLKDFARLCRQRGLGVDEEFANNARWLTWLTSPAVQDEQPMGPPQMMAVPESLSRDTARSLMDDLLVEYRRDTFQRRLLRRWLSTSERKERERLRQDACLDVQVRVVPSYGFEASLRGARCLPLVLQEHMGSGQAEFVEKDEWIQWLTKPVLQARYPRGPFMPAAPERERLSEPAPDQIPKREVLAQVPCPWPADLAVRVISGLSGEKLCAVEVSPFDFVADLKRCIADKKGVPVASQQLLLEGRLLRGDERLGDVAEELLLRPVGGGDGGCEEDEAELVSDLLDVMLINLSPGHSELLQALRDGSAQVLEGLQRQQAPLADRQTALAAVHGRASLLPLVAEELRAERGFLLAALRENGGALEFVPEHLREDKELVLTAVRGSGLVLRFAAWKLRRDREVVLAAVEQNGCTLEHAAEDLKADVEVAAVACRQSLSAERFVRPAAKASPGFWESVAAAHGDLAGYCAAFRNPNLEGGRNQWR